MRESRARFASQTITAGREFHPTPKILYSFIFYNLILKQIQAKRM